MARTQLDVTHLSRLALVTFDQTTWDQLDSTDGNWVVNDGATILALFNDAGAARTVEILVPGGADQDLVVGPRTYALTDQITYLSGYYPETYYSSQLLIDVSGTNVFAKAYTFR